MVEVSKTKAIELLHRQQRLIPELKSQSSDAPGFKKWLRDTEVTITHLFGDNSKYLEGFAERAYSPSFYSPYEPNMANIIHAGYIDGLETASAIIQSMIDEVESFWPGEGEAHAVQGPVAGKTPITNDVFVVHGHDDGAKDTVARFLEKLGLNPVILHEQPNRGRTIIEKFEEESRVAFAVVLLTPDDMGAPTDEVSSLKPRARQNVIFELGYFTGSLGRELVCALVKGDVEKPSDYEGVVYIFFDDYGAWQMALVKELRNAGLDVDANLAL